MKYSEVFLYSKKASFLLADTIIICLPVAGGQGKRIPIGPMQQASRTKREVVSHSTAAAVAASVAVLMFLHTFSPTQHLLV